MRNQQIQQQQQQDQQQQQQQQLQQQPSESGNRYQFRLHPVTRTTTTIEEEEQQQQHQQQQQQQFLKNHNNENNNENKNININRKDNNNKCMKAQMSVSMKNLTADSTKGGRGEGGGGGGGTALKAGSPVTTVAILQRKQFTTAASDGSNASFSSASVAGSIQDDMSDQCSLTQAGLEEYNIRSSSYYDQPVLFHHQKQSSYAQSEGYHSYVSSSDSSSATPFLDRLRQESELLSRQSHHWSQNDLSSVSCNSVPPSPTPLLQSINGRDGGSGDGSSAGDGNGDNQQQQQQQNNSSESTSSTETLKWLGSMSDVSESSHVTGYSAISESVSSSQLIVHSSRVRTPKRHHSESVLYLNNELQQPPHEPPQPHHHQYQPQQQQQQQHQKLHNSYQSPAQISPTTAGRDVSPSASMSSLLRLSPSHRHSPSYPPLHAVHLSALQPPLHRLSPAAAPAKSETSVCCLPNSSLVAAPLGGSNTALPTTQSAVAATLSSPSGTMATASATATACDLQPHKSSLSVTISSTEATPAAPAVVVVVGQPSTASETPIKLGASSPTATTTTTTTPASSALPTSVASSLTPLSTATSSTVSSVSSASNSSSSPSLTSTSTSSTCPSPGSLTTSYRSNHRLFPVSTYTEPVHSNTSQYVQHPKPQYSSGLQKPVQLQQQQQQPQKKLTPTSLQLQLQPQLQLPTPQSPPTTQTSWQSVAELINDFERSHDQQPQKYSYIDPSKTHRVSNPALKAFQKNAVQSYFERQQQQQQKQQQQQQQHSKELNQQKLYQLHASHQLLQQQLIRPHSFQPSASSKELAEQPLLRNSLPNAFAPSTTTLSYDQLPAASPPGRLPKQLFDGSNSILSTQKPPSPAPPPPPPRTRSLMPTLLRRSSSASDCAEFRDQFIRASQEKLQAQSVKNISSSEKSSFNDCGMPPPPPPPRGRVSLPIRRTSSASEYAAMRDKMLQQQVAALAQHRQRTAPPHQYYAPPLPPPSTHATHAAVDWVPERPPKNPNLRVPSPELPPPPTEVDTSLSDEPLPPPPPEILHRPPYYEPTIVPQPTFLFGGQTSPPSPNRRNSFAGSSTRKPPASFFNRSSSTAAATATTTATSEEAVGTIQSPPPPVIPKKPAPIEMLQASRPASTMAQQCNKAHKVLLNGIGSGVSGNMNHHQSDASPPPLPMTCKANSTRKRPHNPANLSNIPPIMEIPVNPSSAPSASAMSNLLPVKMSTKSSPPPPPLKPRMSLASHGTILAISNKLRCNSKASYLPRQSLEKLNNSDPDHGSYKLTLTSNEDLVGPTTKPAYDILAHNGKLPSNLPDVLPLGAKLQSQPISPTSTNASLRYSSSSSSLAPSNVASSTQQLPSCYPHLYPAQHRYSTPAMSSAKNYYHHNSNTNNNNNNAANKTTPNYIRSQSCDVNGNACAASPTKCLSQSTLDLKRTHNLETTLEETLTTASSRTAALTGSSSQDILAPAQSENNLSTSSHNHNNNNNNNNNNKHLTTPLTNPANPPSPYSARREFHRPDMARTLSFEGCGGPESTEGRIVRAELVNATLPISPNNTAGAAKTAVTRKDSLRENIEKITQLQSQLMSAHLSDTGLLNNYGGSTTKSSSNQKPAKLEREELALPAGQQDQTSLVRVSEPNVTTLSPPPTASAELRSSPHKQSDPVATTPSALHAATCEQPKEGVMAQTSQMDCNTDGLKLMQRSEIILRVNPVTVEAASQTDELPDCDMGRLTETHQQHHNKEDSLTRTTLLPRQRHPIEQDCEQLSRELASLLTPNDKLIAILTPTVVKSSADYISNLYNPNVPQRPTKRHVGTSTLMRMKSQRETFNEATERCRVVTVELQYAETNGGGPESCDLLLKKKVDELIDQLNRKLKLLSKEQDSIGEESAINDELGAGLFEKLAAKVRPLEATKFRTYIDDVGHITSLLLSLSGRLAKTENCLSTVDEENAEKKILETKRDRLLEQLEEAKRLKEDIERRGRSLSGMLEKHLSADEFADFDYFINMKAKLIADARDIADKIKCGEEQLQALSEALMQSDC